MGQISQFLRSADGCLGHYCPACRELHCFHISKPNPVTGAQWQWDGHIITPTFTPSMLIKLVKGKKTMKICHYTLTGGTLAFLDDCTHELKSLTMSLPALPEFLRDRGQI